MATTYHIPVTNPAEADIIKEQTWLSAIVLAGSSTLAVQSTAGFSVGDAVALGRLYSETCEVVKVAAVTDSTTLVIEGGVFSRHSAGEPIQSLMYNQIVLQYATTESGAYANVPGFPATIDIDSRDALASHVGGADNTQYWYMYWFTHSTANTTSGITGPAQIGQVSSLDVRVFREDFLVGINLRDWTGKPISDKVLSRYLRRGVKEVETYLGMVLVDTLITDEAHDFNASDYGKFGFMKTFKKPIIEVQSVSIRYPSASSNVVEFPASWVRCDKTYGQIQLIPTVGGNAALLVGSSVWLPLFNGGMAHVPLSLYVTYRAGFLANQIPEDIEAVIYKKAGMSLLLMLGNALYGPGIASKSISMDGVSQSYGTVASGVYGLYASIIGKWQDDVDKQLALIKQRYQGIRMAVL